MFYRHKFVIYAAIKRKYCKKLLKYDKKIQRSLYLQKPYQRMYTIFLKKTVDILFPLVHNKGTFLYAFRIQHFKSFS